jgi:hypothetical protein
MGCWFLNSDRWDVVRLSYCEYDCVKYIPTSAKLHLQEIESAVTILSRRFDSPSWRGVYSSAVARWPLIAINKTIDG